MLAIDEQRRENARRLVGRVRSDLQAREEVVMQRWVRFLTMVAVTGLTRPASAGLVAYYPLDGNTNDASGNGNNGTAFFGGDYTPDVASQVGGVTASQ